MPFIDKEARARYRAEYYRKNRESILKYAKEYREAHPEEVAATKKRIYHERYKTDPAYKERAAEYQRQRFAANPERVKAIEKRCYEAHKEARIAYNKARSKTPERLARDAVNRAVRVGKLPRASAYACACGKAAREYHHHNGYARDHWLDVVAVCAKCHKEHHA
jgi:hypothetical protein